MAICSGLTATYVDRLDIVSIWLGRVMTPHSGSETLNKEAAKYFIMHYELAVLGGGMFLNY